MHTSNFRSAAGISALLASWLPLAVLVVAIAASATSFNSPQASDLRPQVHYPLLQASNYLNSSTANQTSSAITSHYMNSQAIKFRVNVSNLCEKNQMHVTIRLNRPFYGLIHTKDKRKKLGCFIEGNGEQLYLMDISYTLLASDPNSCGVVAHPAASGSNSRAQNQSQTTSMNQQTLSVILVVRLHKSIEFSEDRYFLLSCANRCSRSDCSNRKDNLQSNAESSPVSSSSSSSHSSLGRGFAISESILTSQLRPNSELENLSLDSDNLVSLADGSGERCNYIHGLKFQWLIRLCWLLSSLLLLVLCVAFFLCLTLNRKSRQKTSKSTRVSALSNQSSSSSSSSTNQLLYLPANESLNNWSATTATSNPSTTTLTSNNEHNGNNMIESDNLDKIRENNSFLAKQHQQYLRANLFVERQQGQQLQHPMELGITAKNLGRSAQNHHHHQLIDSQRVRRRRSIGGSTQRLATADEEYLQSQVAPTEKLHASQRAKSRSQTTIHYDQSQDPFKTVPFSYIHTHQSYPSAGYASDNQASPMSSPIAQHSHHHHHHTLHHQQQNPPRGTHGDCRAYGDLSQVPQIQSIMKQRCEEPQSLPAIYAATSQEMHPPDQQWQQNPNFRLTQGRQDQMLLDANNNLREQQQQQASQFDPQNSRQLINLIQHKHRQQLAQATKTAATLHQSPAWRLNQAMNQPRAWN